jgi:hypothetical protein
MLQQQIHRSPHKLYAFERGWEVTQNVSQAAWEWASTNARRLFNSIVSILDWTETAALLFKSFGYLAIGLLVLLAAIIYVSTVVFIILFFCIHVGALIIMMIVALLAIALLRASCWLYAHVFGIYYYCPHAGCYKKTPIPTFICPTCQALHSRLWPDVYGIFTHRCSCGAKLPTLDMLGRRKLARICSDCKAPLNEIIGQGTNIDIAIIGGPSSGKTTYMVMAMNALKKFFGAPPFQYAINFADPYHERIFSMRLGQLEAGRPLAKTSDTTPPAFYFTIKAPDAQIPKLVFLYDAAGEVFDHGPYRGLQTYYSHVHGLIFLIDPCAIPLYKRTRHKEIEQLRLSIGLSDLDVDQILDGMLHLIEDLRGVRTIRSHPIPIAVVVTKIDAFGLEDEIGLPAAQQWLIAHTHKDGVTSQSLEEAMHFVVRDFLSRYGLGNMLDQLERNFSAVRYFSCSALGRMPHQTDYRRFVPVRVLEPLAWLLAQNGVAREK